MGNLSVTEYAYIGLDKSGNSLGVGQEPALQVQNVDFSILTSGLSQKFDRDTKLVRILADSDCKVVFGLDDIDAVNGGSLVAAGVPEYFGVQGSIKVSVVGVA